MLASLARLNIVAEWKGLEHWEELFADNPYEELVDEKEEEVEKPVNEEEEVGENNDNDDDDNYDDDQGEGGDISDAGGDTGADGGNGGDDAGSDTGGHTGGDSGDVGGDGDGDDGGGSSGGGDSENEWSESIDEQSVAEADSEEPPTEYEKDGTNEKIVYETVDRKEVETDFSQDTSKWFKPLPLVQEQLF
ncbi:hypothetical protein L1987_57759 [Smallanthus sonchifolius]|uniref:Uncharacterized protein n=1 Tax=Smallanthus sonchifolius TaxID=185202 RepID=A0ACB9DE09_9ASTR|nr:hypothetical protein L1987_57759 [Smallanthus sonchifolius]